MKALRKIAYEPYIKIRLIRRGPRYYYLRVLHLFPIRHFLLQVHVHQLELHIDGNMPLLLIVILSNILHFFDCFWLAHVSHFQILLA